MSLNLSFGRAPNDPGADAWSAELDRALVALGLPPHVEPAVPLQAWSFGDLAGPLLDAAERAPGGWAVLGRFSINDAVFVPQPVDGVHEGPDGLSVASLATLVVELDELGARLEEAGVGEDAPERRAVAVLGHAARAALAGGAALWLR